MGPITPTTPQGPHTTAALLEFFLGRAIALGASDVHFEPTCQGTLRVRMRLDGVLHTIASPPEAKPEEICSRIKVLSRLDIAQKRLPQDGRMQFLATGSQIEITSQPMRKVDIRVSTLPTIDGEKVVLRILDSSALELTLDALGYSEKEQELVLAALARPHGMVLLTGPTGSGKTASLYTFLSLLNQPERNVCSVEDPVEVYLRGVNQVGVNEAAGLGFASAMRAFLRQDPDVMMVGEIRDSETAAIAVKAAQTGHIVLSTLHTNDAPSAIARLRSMEVAPYHLGDSINLIGAQRLLRRLCPHCKVVDSEGSYKAHTPGCTHCYQGYFGRVAVFQLMPITEAINQAIVQGAPTSEIEAIARAQGLRSLRELAMEKVLAGLTSRAQVWLHT